ncbi:uncharacterized protein HKW66_Vig0247460 [Vigna angularis]|uniref:Uncharacterized protein n=1 Tax=Phaseolus angularis TaxID=3914 RepID=A0A8T0KTE8_PHAAN|nr:uncharacterized protein HKW66_Vig0247460 [Vigna angularis]
MPKISLEALRGANSADFDAADYAEWLGKQGEIAGRVFEGLSSEFQWLGEPTRGDGARQANLLGCGSSMVLLSLNE